MWGRCFRRGSMYQKFLPHSHHRQQSDQRTQSDLMIRWSCGLKSDGVSGKGSLMILFQPLSVKSEIPNILLPVCGLKMVSPPHLSHIEGGVRLCEQEVAGIVLTVSGGGWWVGWLEGEVGVIAEVGQGAANLGTTPPRIQATTIYNYYKAKQLCQNPCSVEFVCRFPISTSLTNSQKKVLCFG